MTDPITALREVLALSKKATPGPWHVQPHSRGAGEIKITGASYESRPRYGPVASAWANLAGPLDDECVAEMKAGAALIASAVNLLRTHGPALLSALEDARRYRWLRETGDNQYRVAISAKAGDVLDAAIDAAREARNG